MLGFKNFNRAQRTLSGIELVRMLKKGNYDVRRECQKPIGIILWTANIIFLKAALFILSMTLFATEQGSFIYVLSLLTKSGQ